MTICLNSCEANLDYWLPNHFLQTALDDIRGEISLFLAYKTPPARVQIGGWLDQTVVFLTDLPYEISSNILCRLKDLGNALNQIVLYPLAHPLKTPLELIKLAIRLLEEILRAENWIKFGAGTIASAIGYSVVSPINPLALQIGAAILGVGITANLITQVPFSQSLKLTLTAAATSLCSWYAIGNFQRALSRLS